MLPYKVLVDEHMGGQNLVSVCKAMFEQAVFVQQDHSIPPRTSDPELFRLAHENGYNAILTYDGKTLSPEDLCITAQIAYQGSGEHLPGVIVLPSSNRKGDRGHSRAIKKLLNPDTYDRIKRYLEEPPKSVLDLREFRAYKHN